MIIKFGVAVVGARGTAGGLTFSANAFGPYAKTWSRSANQRTTAQSTQRGILGSFAKGWDALTGPQRNGWIAYSRDPAQDLINSLGETYSASGFNWYVRINTHLTIAGAAARDVAPTLTRPLAPIIQLVQMRVGGTPTQSVITFTVGDPDLTALHIAFARIVNSLGITTVPDKMPFIVIAVPNASRIIFIKTPVEARFGQVAIGQQILVSSRIQDAHGQRGPEDTFIEDVVA